MTSWDEHPFLRWQVRPETVRARWSSDAAVALVSEGRRGMTVTALGAPAAAARLLGDALAAYGNAVRMSVPRGTLPILAATDPDVAQRVDAGDDWDWFLTDAPPPVQPGEQDVVLVRDDDAVATLLAHASPRASVAAGAPSVDRWFGVSDHEAGLVAVAANAPMKPPVPHLASVTTHPDHRGRGLGRAVSAALTRALMTEGAPVVTLGMYADNDRARAVYTHLGFTCGAEFSSRRLLPP